jgi:hypothetical protein
MVSNLKSHRGNSGASLEIISTESGDFIRKSNSNNIHKLKSQYDWLQSKQDKEYIAKILSSTENENSFSYDMFYYKDFNNIYEYIINNDTSTHRILIEKIIDTILDLNKVPTGKTSKKIFKNYIEEKLSKKLDTIASSLHELDQYNIEGSIEIGDKQYLGINSIIQEITSHNFFNYFSSFDLFDVHGDLTVENILIDNDYNIIFIDSNCENELSTIHLEIAKLSQSLSSHYELLLDQPFLRDQEFKRRRDLIKNMEEVFETILNEKFDKKERELIRFHEAIHLIRLIPYQNLKTNKDAVLAFLERAIILFNDVIYGLRQS